MAVNSRNEILVLDSTLQWVYRYDAAGNLLDRFGGPAATLYHPRGISVFEDDTVAVSNTGYARLALFSLDGTSAGGIGQTDDGPSQLSEPTDVVRDLQDTYFVAEATKSRVQRLDAWGNTLNQWAIPVASAYDGPHLALAPDGSVFVTGSQSHSLLRYAPDGTLLNNWQTIGPVRLDAPVGIYLDSATNRLYIADVQTHQVHVFEVQMDIE